jgi:Zinc knuckle
LSNQNQGSQNNDRCQGQGFGNSNTNTNSGKGKEKLKGNHRSDGNKKPKPDRLSKDGKLTPEEHQRRMDNQLCLVCAQSGHRARECPKAKSARAAKASEEKTSESKAETSALGAKK